MQVNPHFDAEQNGVPLPFGSVGHGPFPPQFVTSLEVSALHPPAPSDRKPAKQLTLQRPCTHVADWMPAPVDEQIFVLGGAPHALGLDV